MRSNRAEQRSRDEELNMILAQLVQLQASQAERAKEQAERDKEQDERDRNRYRREARQVRWQVVQLIIAVAAVAAVIASVVALFQGASNLKQQQESAAQQDQESRYSSVSELSLNLDQTIADHPRLISCFQNGRCNAKPALTGQEMQQATMLAGYIVDYYQYLYDQLESLGYVPNSGLFTLRKDAIPGVTNENWVTWSETIVDGFKYSTLVCDYLIKWADTYEQSFVHAVAVTHTCPGLPDPGPSPY